MLGLNYYYYFSRSPCDPVTWKVHFACPLVASSTLAFFCLPQNHNHRGCTWLFPPSVHGMYNPIYQLFPFCILYLLGKWQQSCSPLIGRFLSDKDHSLFTAFCLHTFMLPCYPPPPTVGRDLWAGYSHY